MARTSSRITGLGVTSAHKDVVKLLTANSRHRRTVEVFHDWVFSMSVAYRRFHGVPQALATEYDSVLGGYSDAERQRFADAHDALVGIFEEKLGDHLGAIYMALPHGGEGLGQFFTPYDVATLIARMSYAPGMVEALESKQTVTVLEPACGAGAMVIALCEVLRQHEVDYQRRVWFDLADISLVAVHMAHVQLSMIGASAVVRHQNTLTQEQWDAYPTPIAVVLASANTTHKAVTP